MKLIAVFSLIALVSAASIEIEAETEGKRNVGINTDSNETLSNATLVPGTAGSVAPNVSGSPSESAVNSLTANAPATSLVNRPTTQSTSAQPATAYNAMVAFGGLVQAFFGILFVAVIIGAISNKNNFNPVSKASSSASFEIVQASPMRFTDVLGCDEIRNELLQILDVMKNPERYQRFGAKTPKGVLLKGPPGTGKTLIAKALAGESNIPLISTSGSAFEEALVGVGAARVRDLFNTARSRFNQTIIFIDEIDGIAGKRSHDSKNTLTLNQLLVEMDGFNPSKIFVLAATNAYKDLDPAILRPGRFDQVLTLNLPDAKGRAQIIVHNLKDVKELVDSAVNFTRLAAETIGFSGAELAQLVNQAKLIAASADAKLMEEHHFHQALSLTRFGPKRAVLMSRKDRERVSLHEAGHAVVGLLTSGAMPVHSATIIPHASSMGMVVSVPGEGEAYFSSAEAYLARIDVSLAGWLAEELAFELGQVSFGAMSDLQKANSLARQMVDAGFGMRTGFHQPLLAPNPQFSSEHARRSYEEDVKDILEASKERVRSLLKDNEAGWRRVAEELIKYETLSGAQMQMIMDTMLYCGEPDC